MNDVDRFHNRAIIIFLILIFAPMLLGCSTAPKRCDQWPDIQKESRYADFHCRSESKRGLFCNRQEGHYGDHHSHSVDDAPNCVNWN